METKSTYLLVDVMEYNYKRYPVCRRSVHYDEYKLQSTGIQLYTKLWLSLECAEYHMKISIIKANM